MAQSQWPEQRHSWQGQSYVPQASLHPKNVAVPQPQSWSSLQQADTGFTTHCSKTPKEVLDLVLAWRGSRSHVQFLLDQSNQAHFLSSRHDSYTLSTCPWPGPLTDSTVQNEIDKTLRHNMDWDGMKWEAQKRQLVTWFWHALPKRLHSMLLIKG